VQAVRAGGDNAMKARHGRRQLALSKPEIRTNGGSVRLVEFASFWHDS
jgi:hypothetical protein